MPEQSLSVPTKIVSLGLVKVSCICIRFCLSPVSVRNSCFLSFIQSSNCRSLSGTMNVMPGPNNLHKYSLLRVCTLDRTT